MDIDKVKNVQVMHMAGNSYSFSLNASSDWVAVVDPESNRTYYANMRTMRTQ